MACSALLCCLVFLAGVGASQSQETPSENSCTYFPGSLPNMLRELRMAFDRVKTFFQKKDQLDNMLLNKSLLEDFKGYLGCQALSEMIKFYLEVVMPQAENHGPDIKEHVNSLGEKLTTLRIRLRRCVSRSPVFPLEAVPTSYGTVGPRDTPTGSQGHNWAKHPESVRSLAHFCLSRGWGGC
ncbi:interleukin-10 isoform X1 [Loxodonta africana]|uniref:interleukin-10 isoform X1 n=1 Tax=Loxodonta africana TaxID=9785 RepID=UPI000C8120EC|nr:interleukin-10 isoform X1 [Loxodonta africana]